MLKNDVAVVGAGLGGATVAYGLQQKNYRAYLINGSEQDNRTIPDAKNVLILEGYDGLAGSCVQETHIKTVYILLML